MNKPPLHVAVGILVNEQAEVLVALRPENLHQGGLWEFPGGKVEAGENLITALRREFREEVNLDIIQARPFMEVRHDYGDKHVWLDVWLCRDFSGEAVGREGQQVRWAGSEELAGLEFPAANKSILGKVLEYLRNGRAE